LADYFAKFGEVVDAFVVMDRESGKSRGYGFVTFSDEKAAEDCMSHEGHTIGGRDIVVQKPQQRQEYGGGFRGGRGGGYRGGNRDYGRDDGYRRDGGSGYRDRERSNYGDRREGGGDYGRNY